MKEQHNRFEDFPQEEVRLAIRTGITQAQKMAPKQNNRSRKVMYAFYSVAAVFGIIIFTSFYSPAVANTLSKIPIIGSVFGNSDLLGLQQAEENGLITEIGETKTINGISVTLKEVLYDQNNITIGLIIESEKALGEQYFGAGMDFTINGKMPRVASGSYGEKIISETTRTAIQTISITEEIPDQFELGLILQGEKGEKWKFSTPIAKIKDIMTIPVQHKQTVDGITLTVTDISLSKTGVSVTFESSEEAIDFNETRGQYIDFQMVDQNGNEITSLSGGVIGEMMEGKIVYKSTKQFDPITPNVTELKIMPYLAIPSAGGRGDENGEYYEIDFRTIKNVEFKPFTVEIPK